MITLHRSTQSHHGDVTCLEVNQSSYYGKQSYEGLWCGNAAVEHLCFFLTTLNHNGEQDDVTRAQSGAARDFSVQKMSDFS